MNPLDNWPAFPIGKIILNAKGKKEFPGGLPKEWQNTKQKSKDIKGNAGLVPGKGRVVIDIDASPRADEAKACLYKLAITTIQKTQSGMIQGFFNCPDAPEGNAIILAGRTGELRKGNAFVIRPGSKTEQGTSWEIINSQPVATVTWKEITEAFEPFLKEESKDAKAASLKEPDTSRSAQEYWHIVNLIKKGYTKKQCFEKMGIYAKWSETGPAYKEHQYKNALIKAEEEKERTTLDNKQEIELPKTGKLISEFAEEVAEIIKDKKTMFYRIDQREIVEIGKILHHKTGVEIYTGFIPVGPSRFITLAEKHFAPGVWVVNSATKDLFFKKKSMKRETGNTVLCSKIMEQALPQIERIFTIPLPIVDKGKLSFPKQGYDINFGSWLPYDAPKITSPSMSLKKAKQLIKEMLKEFCFETEQDHDNAIAALLTPYLRGLFPTFNTRTPVCFYLANRERIGKDYLAGITSIVYEGNVLQEPPVSTNENRNTNSNEELRKKLLSAMISGRKRLHFANCKGFINNAVFEAIVTAETYSDRKLGSNQSLQFDNEMDFSLSGNAGITYTADFANRCIFIKQFFAEENANLRKFENPNLQQWVKENRGEVISALYALVRNWFDKDQPKGTHPFASFPQWAEICGGIMEAAGYKSPCVIDVESMNIGGDKETTEMKELFELCFENHPGEWISMQEIKDLILDEGNLFGYLKLEERAGATKLGLKISKFIGRILSEIRLEVDDKKVRGNRQKFLFSKITAVQGNLSTWQKPNLSKEKTIQGNLRHSKQKVGNVGNVGNVLYPRSLFTNKTYKEVGNVAKVAKVAKTKKKEEKDGSIKPDEVSYIVEESATGYRCTICRKSIKVGPGLCSDCKKKAVAAK